MYDGSKYLFRIRLTTNYHYIVYYIYIYINNVIYIAFKLKITEIVIDLYILLLFRYINMDYILYKK